MGAERGGRHARRRAPRRYSKNPGVVQQCGGHVLTEHSGFGLVDVYAAVLPELPFKPMLHVNYSETVLHIHGGQPKLKDFPSELGGSGAAVPE